VREGYPIETLPNLLNFDVSLPIAQIGDYAIPAERRFTHAGRQSHNSFYGHVGDSNVHICVSVEYGRARTCTASMTSSMAC
jgi:FAD/FMN-containing dehydrogenase